MIFIIQMLNKTHDNYNATIVIVDKVHTLDNMDKVVWFNYFWFQALISKDTPIGCVGLFIPTGTQLNKDFLRKNNLYASKDLNEDQSVAGYMWKNGCVKAIRLRGNVSNALFLPITMLDGFVNYDKLAIHIGESFNVVDGFELCKKFIPECELKKWPARLPKKEVRVERKYIPEHVDTQQFLRYLEEYNPEDYIYVSQKLHGTSVILWHTYINPKRTFWDRLFWRKKQPTMWYVASSRRVIKGVDDNTWFYDVDIWSECLRQYKNQIPKGFLIYGEIVGWVWDTPIQKGYTYECPKWQWDLFVYRVVTVNPDGVIVDLSRPAMVEWCRSNGFKTVVPLWEGKFKDFNYEEYIDKVYSNTYTGAIRLSDPKSVDEWVVIRKEWLIPDFKKCKWPMFYEYESWQAEAWEVNVEDQN